MSDLISRKAVMNHIENEYREWGEEYDALQILGDIEDMPSAEKRGKWIISKVNGQYQCSNCGMFTGLTAEDVESGFYLMKYCGNCGARMEE